MKKRNSLLLASACIMLSQQTFAMDSNAMLRSAALSGNLGAVKNALKQGASIDSMDKEGYSALMEAVTNGHENVVKFLLERGANVNLQMKYPGAPAKIAGYSALILAIMQFNPKMVRLLLEYDADKTATTNGDEPVALFALIYENSEIEKLLMKEIQEYKAKKGLQ